MTSSWINKVDIIILNYNGAEILPLCLPSIAEAARSSPVPCQVTVLDNKSTDMSLDYVRKNFPEIRVVIAKENKVLFSYNDLIPELDSDIVILLNNDVKVDRHFIPYLLEPFRDNEVFAVAPKQMNFNGIGYNGGKNRIEFVHGLLSAGQQTYGDANPVMETAGFTHYNANSAYDRRKFIELGGFDGIFSPFTWEDTDLGYRAWKKGYKFIYEPKSVISHNESYTINRESKNIRNRSIVTKRNSFLFTWKNISDPSLLLIHIILLPLNLLGFLLYDRNRLLAFFEALKFLPRIKRNKDQYILSDKEILALK